MFFLRFCNDITFSYYYIYDLILRLLLLKYFRNVVMVNLMGFLIFLFRIFYCFLYLSLMLIYRDDFKRYGIDRNGLWITF